MGVEPTLSCENWILSPVSGYGRSMTVNKKSKKLHRLATKRRRVTEILASSPGRGGNKRRRSRTSTAYRLSWLANWCVSQASLHLGWPKRQVVEACILKELRRIEPAMWLPPFEDRCSIHYSVLNCFKDLQACHMTLENILRRLDEGKPISAIRDEIEGRLPRVRHRARVERMGDAPPQSR